MFPIYISTFVSLFVIMVWILLVDYDYVTALSVFAVLLPLWVFFKYLQWPFVSVGGTTIPITVLKDVLLVFFFAHWLLTSVRERSVRIPVLPSVLVFFAVMLLGLTQAGLVDYLLLARPYTEMFLLVSVPILGLSLSADDINRLLLALLLGCSITVFIALYHAFVDPQFLLSEQWIRADIWGTYRGTVSAFNGGRLQSITGNPNVLPLVAAIGGLIALFYTTDRNDQFRFDTRSVFGLIFACSTVVIMFSRSRDTIVFYFLISILYLAIAGKKRILGIGLATFVIAFLLNYQTIVDNYLLLLENGNPRFVTWSRGIKDLGWQLPYGVGDTTAVDQALDSSFYKVLVQFGVVGLVVFVWYNFRVIVTQLRYSVRQSGIHDVLLLVFLMLCSSFAFSVNVFNFPFTFVYWLVFALILTQWRLGTTALRDRDVEPAKSD